MWGGGSPGLQTGGALKTSSMTPSNLMLVGQSRLLAPKERNKLRKPMIEKMRRDRMNSSIEQLKRLLEKELQGPQAGSKLEKANVLEMAVSYLKHQSRAQQGAGAAPKGREVDFQEGYARCLQEVSRFLILHQVYPQAQNKLMGHFRHVPLPAPEPACGKPPGPTKPLHSLWRPWMEPSRR